ncbi:MAG: DUF4294 domain-containing protein [Prolixibacteraceae bacterium]|nr:DUF4294 domain-containing protein [Prolixibacteraceae bacterium]MBN2649919.1 DUF4294 domain-containing protein [Prolixibacteraceae bacterium]
MKIAYNFIMLLFFVAVPLFGIAQDETTNDTVLFNSNNDSLLFVELETVDIYPERGKKLNYRKYSRLVRKIRKVYPFAREAVVELEKYNELYENTTDEREKRKYVRQVEKELFRRHEDELKKFTISEGRYLVLLIDRETGNTSYSIIKELKGGLPALFWQGIAKIFNNDLKEEYDPLYKHFVIEQIVTMVEKEYEQEQIDKGKALPSNR